MINVAPTTNPSLPGEISLLARELRASSFGAITQREAIERARVILAARRSHAADCAVRAIRLAVTASADGDCERYTESALRFIGVALKAA